MSQTDPLLDRGAIQDAFRRLGDRLVRRGVVADIYVIGGAAMALAYDSRRSTRDIDAVFQPHGVVLDEARAVAAELGISTLVGRLGLSSTAEVLAVCAAVFPDEPVPERARLVLEDLLGEG